MHARAFFLFAALAAPIVFAGADAFAQAGSSSGGLLQGTAEEQRACVRDVQRHCREAMPDTFRVLACLQAQRNKISKPCLAVLESHGQ